MAMSGSSPKDINYTGVEELLMAVDDIEVELKRCARCGEWKDAKVDFHANHMSKDGRNSSCKPCIAKYQTERDARMRQDKLRYEVESGRGKGVTPTRHGSEAAGKRLMRAQLINGRLVYPGVNRRD